MFFWSRQTDIGLRTLTRYASALIAFATFSVAAPNGAMADVKDAIVKIVTSGIRDFGGRIEEEKGYKGSGFIVKSEKTSGGAQTVIVTAKHVLGYPKNSIPQFPITGGDAPPVWVNRSDPNCNLPDLKVEDKFSLDAEKPCRRIQIYYYDSDGTWTPYDDGPIYDDVSRVNADYAVLLVKYAHNDERALEIGSSKLIDEASGHVPTLKAQRWGIDAQKADNSDASTEQIEYARNDQGPTLIFNGKVVPGNSGGPVIFNDKVIGIISAFQNSEISVTPISAAYPELAYLGVIALSDPAAPRQSQIVQDCTQKAINDALDRRAFAHSGGARSAGGGLRGISNYQEVQVSYSAPLGYEIIAPVRIEVVASVGQGGTEGPKYVKDEAGRIKRVDVRVWSNSPSQVFGPGAWQKIRLEGDLQRILKNNDIAKIRSRCENQYHRALNQTKMR